MKIGIVGADGLRSRCGQSRLSRRSAQRERKHTCRTQVWRIGDDQQERVGRDVSVDVRIGGQQSHSLDAYAGRG